tara:strand:- start:2352 stop:3923 length:1572 start_codon:yes stop_codon:yes gene_type:complete
MSNAPLLINSTEIYPCKFLCDLKIEYSKLTFKHDSSTDRFLITRLEGSELHDVIFRENKYKLIWFTISDTVHKSVNSEYKGELTLVHENIDLKRERLIISIPLKIINDASKEYSLAQDVFYQIRRKIKTPKKEDESWSQKKEDGSWSMQNVLPKKRSFYLYKGGYPFQEFTDENFFDYKNVVMDNYVFIKEKDFVFLETKKEEVSDEIERTDIPVYYNNGDIQYKGEKKCDNKPPDGVYDGYKMNDSCVQPHIVDDEPKELFKSLSEKITIFMIGLLGLIMYLGFFKGNELFNSPIIRFIIKSIGFMLWGVAHVAYVFISWIETVFLFIGPLIITFILSCIFRKSERFPNWNKSIYTAMKEGIYTSDPGLNMNNVFKYITLFFTISFLFTYFINLFGFPFKGKSSYGAFNSVKYVKGGILCRNGVRQVGKNISIDECNGNINLEEYITNPEIRKIFEEEYERLKNNNMSAYDAMGGALRKLGKKYEFGKNHEYSDGTNAKMCDIYNVLFAKQFNLKCRTVKSD